MREKNRLLRIHSWHHGFGTKGLFMLILFWKNFWGCQLSSRESRSVNMPTEQWWMLYDWFFFFLDLESKNLIWVLGVDLFFKMKKASMKKDISWVWGIFLETHFNFDVIWLISTIILVMGSLLLYGILGLYWGCSVFCWSFLSKH